MGCCTAEEVGVAGDAGEAVVGEGVEASERSMAGEWSMVGEVH